MSELVGWLVGRVVGGGWWWWLSGSGRVKLVTLVMW